MADADAFGGVDDLIVFGDALHDMGDPVGVVAHARTRLTSGGRAMVIEPFAVDDRATNPTQSTAQVFYVGSTFLCLPNALSQHGDHALGARRARPGCVGCSSRPATRRSAGLPRA